MSASNENHAETADQKYIRLLTILAQADGSISFIEDATLSDIRALSELCSGGFISASIVRDEVNRPCAVGSAEIIPSGRAYLAELKRREESLTSVGLIKHNRFHFYRWFFGIVGVVIAALAVWYLKKHFL